MSEYRESKITINGTELSEAQSMTVRVAIQQFIFTLEADGMGDDDHGAKMAEAYLRRCSEINALIRK